ncbi:60S ribosomal export protein NMD3-like [Tubulanus polymorphus]|uniref:60S ribosomal export protein NMD3-like n=1 Tax=Tubulanus polymorphus TaxID=672921 RepID=UPI003DA4BAB1
MEALEIVGDQHVGYILCCECGVQIEPNPANMCVACLRSQVDITEGIPKQMALHFCRNCERYHQPPAAWVPAALESRELLSICLKKLKGLSKVRLIDASFVWTEPHSKRIKVKLTIQKEVNNGAILQQTFIVEYIVSNQMCDDCHRVEAKDYWKAVVQVRQKTAHKKTLFYLEQLILKHKAHTNTTSIKTLTDGMDFFYANKQDARKFTDFLLAVVPCRYQTSQQLISHDQRSNLYNYKYTYSVEIVPVCKDEIVCLPAKLAQQLGNLGRIAVCNRVTQTIHLIDPNTCQIAEVNSNVFWRSPFTVICGPKQLVEYLVMQVDIIGDKHLASGHGRESVKHVLADVYVVKASEVGVEEPKHCRTHLGHLLLAGDSVLGFDLSNANVNDANLDKMKQEQIPDVVLIKKVYGDNTRRMRRRRWKLKHLNRDIDDGSSIQRDYNDFLNDLEEDVDYRQNVDIYLDREKVAVETDDSEYGDEAPKISLQEMLDDLHISNDATGGEGDDMIE